MASTPEGDDKGLKYPLIFQRSRSMVINKIDLMPHLDYDIDKMSKDFYNVNPEGKVFPLSSKTGDRFDSFIEWIKGEVTEFSKNE